MKMETLRNDIMNAIEQGNYMVPRDCFDPPFGLSELTDCIIMETLKNVLDSSAKRHSLRHLILEKVDESLFDAEKEAYRRRLKYAQIHKNRRLERMKDEWGEGAYWDEAYTSLSAPNMSNITDKLSGLSLTYANYQELTTMRTLAILDKVIDKSICSSKKVSNTKFKELFAEYDNWISALQQDMEDASGIINNTLAFYTLEWSYCLELLYHCSQFEEEHGIDAMDAISLLAFIPTDAHLGGWRVSTENRFVLHRLSLIEPILDAEYYPWMEMKINNYLIIKAIIKNKRFLEGLSIKEWIIQNTDESDWADFITNHYPLLANPRHHCWTNKRISIFRRLVNQTFLGNDKNHSDTAARN